MEKRLIRVLDEGTIDKIAAGEVVERPQSVVKELLENALDAGASAVSVDIKNGGTDLIRVTDNGKGIGRNEVRKAFLPHATSKLTFIEDLYSIDTLGFRGEALSSIASVSKVELLTKEAEDPLGIRYVIEGGTEVSFDEAGIPDGSTFIVRDLFYNTPARRKFLKSPATEAGYISSMVEEMALNRPDVSFKYSVNNTNRLLTPGNGDLKEVIYRIFGRDISDSLLSVNAEREGMVLSGYISKPVVARNSRSLENYFVNSRYVKDNIISKAIEDGYAGFLMQHRFPFTVLKLSIPGNEVDINVHPRKMEIRFSKAEGIYDFIRTAVRDVLSNREFINDFTFGEEKKNEAPLPPADAPEPFEIGKIREFREEKAYITQEKPEPENEIPKETEYIEDTKDIAPERLILKEMVSKARISENISIPDKDISGEQMDFFEEKILSKEFSSEYRIAGEVFDTYWIVEFKDQMLLIDQHAAHEKVNFERFMAEFKKREVTTQNLNPPLILTLDSAHREILERFLNRFTEMGFEIEPFGGNDFAVRTVPYNLYGLDSSEVLTSLLDELSEGIRDEDLSVIYNKIASMSCKAAVKGGNSLSFAEARALIEELLSLNDPYTCPHGRPTIIKMSKSELEKKFKRIV